MSAGATTLLERLSAIDARFAVRPAVPHAAGWLACDRLLDAASPELAEALAVETHASGHISQHAAALSLLAAYACTVTTAAVAGWALEGEVLDMRADNVAVELGDHHGVEAYAVREPRLVPGGVDALVDTALVGHLLPLADALHERTRAGLRQLHGGVGFGLAAAYAVLSRRPGTGGTDALEASYRSLVSATAARTGVDLDALGDLVRVRAGEREALCYLRQTCCLVYTSAEDTLCASCCLTPAPERIAAYRDSLAR